MAWAATGVLVVVLVPVCGSPLKTTALWPVTVSSFPLSQRGVASLAPPKLHEDLAAVALAQYHKYVKEILPTELKMDRGVAAEFREGDQYRTNLAFARWQKRVFMNFFRVDESDLTSTGERAPQITGVPYTWPELLKSAAYASLKGKLLEISRLYMETVGYKKRDIPRNFRIWIWAEVVEPSGGMPPISLTDGGFLAGRYIVQAPAGGSKVIFQDARGINPPYGQAHAIIPSEGEVIAHPIWAPHFLTPNTGNKSLVTFCFKVYPEDGNSLDWEDDKTGDVRASMNWKAKISF